MRTVVTIRFDGDNVPGGASTVLDKAGCGSDVAVVGDVPVLGQVVVRVTLDTVDERLRILLDLLFTYNVRWSELREDHYTEEELEHARLVMMWPETEYKILGGPKMETTYDLTRACKTCGAGVEQTSPMIIANDDVPKIEGRRAVSTYYSDILVDERLAEQLEALDVKGLSFRGVYSNRYVYSERKDGRPTKLRWKQLVAARNMPPISPASTGIRREDPCSSCNRSGYSTWSCEPARVAYSAKDLRDIDDVMTTWEWFGDVDFDGTVSGALLPYPWFLVTPKVMRVIRDAGVDTFRWLPVRLVDRDS